MGGMDQVRLSADVDADALLHTALFSSPCQKWLAGPHHSRPCMHIFLGFALLQSWRSPLHCYMPRYPTNNNNNEPFAFSGTARGGKEAEAEADVAPLFPKIKGKLFIHIPYKRSTMQSFIMFMIKIGSVCCIFYLIKQRARKLTRSNIVKQKLLFFWMREEYMLN